MDRRWYDRADWLGLGKWWAIAGTILLIVAFPVGVVVLGGGVLLFAVWGVWWGNTQRARRERSFRAHGAQQQINKDKEEEGG